MVKKTHLPLQERCRFDPWVGKILWMRAWQPTPVFLPGKSHGRRSLVDGPWGCRELDMTEQLHFSGFPGGACDKESACQCRRCKRRGFDPWVGKIPWRREWQHAPLFSSGKSHGQRSLVGYSPWGCKESDTTKCTHTGTS